MKWEKQGRVYVPDGSLSWAQHYAFPPTPIRVRKGEIRIYLASCDEDIVGRVGYVDLDEKDPSRVLRVSEKPVLDIGSPGAFDESGVVPTCVLEVDGKYHMYYVGYQRGHRVRYFQFEGLAVSSDGGESFERVQKVPVIDRSDSEFGHRTSAFVMRENGLFRMWYVAGNEWTRVGDKTLPVYNLKYVESANGIDWPRQGRTALDFKDDDEHAFGRPWVRKTESGYELYFSHRRRSCGYRIGFARSKDAIDWQREDEAVTLDVSPEGWDSEMVAYTSLWEGEEQTYLFYCGNQCGKTGFGYAVLQKEPV